MAYRSSSIGSVVNGATHTVAVPSGLANGDKVTLIFVEEAAVTSPSSIPAGFTLATTDASTVSGFRALNVRRWWKDITDAAGEGSGGDYTVTFGASAIGYLIAVAHSGRDTGAGSDINTDDGAAAASPLSVALTGLTAAAGSDLVWIGVVAPDDDIDIFSITSSCTEPGSYTSRQTMNSLWRIGQLATRDNVSAGATGTLTGSVTFTNAGTANFAGLVVELPAAAGGGSSVPNKQHHYRRH